MWDMNKGQSAKSSQGFVKEGNVDVFIFSEKKERVQFLTEQVSVEQVMADQKLDRNGAEEFIMLSLAREKWIQPIVVWEHTVPAVQGQRYFSTLACYGVRDCVLCRKNDEAKNNGVTENKFLPFPVRKRFVVPAYFYSMKRVLFVKASQEFFVDIANYVNSNTGPVDFELYKVGTGLNTKYKSMFCGPAAKVTVPVPCPDEVSLQIPIEELDKRIRLGAVEKATTQEAFVIPFGNHKGKTIAEVWAIDRDYIEFLSKNSSGLLMDKVKEFLNGIKA